jgi:hypothetical protein
MNENLIETHLFEHVHITDMYAQIATAVTENCGSSF